MTWDRWLYFPSEGRRAEDFFDLKIRRLQPGLKPQTWVLKASTLPLDHRSRRIQIYREINGTFNLSFECVDKCRTTYNRPGHVSRTFHWLHTFCAFFCCADISNKVITAFWSRVHFMICEVNSLCLITENSSNTNCLWASTNPCGTECLLDGFSYFIPEDFLKICWKKIQVLVKSDKDSGYFTNHWTLLRMRHVAEKIRIHFTFKTFSENCAVYEMWKNVLARRATDGNIISGTCFACWITKARIHTYKVVQIWPGPICV